MRTSLILMLTLLICLAQAPLSAQDNKEFDFNHFLTEKKAIIEENMPLTESEKQLFWPFYDGYMKTYTELLSRRSALERKFMKEQENITDKKAKAVIDGHFQLLSDGLKNKKTQLAKLRKILPETKVLKFFQLEEKIEIGFLYHLAENIPLMK